MYFETGDRICADFRRSGNADHAPVIEYSMGGLRSLLRCF